jgi:twitching motility protein PilT
MARLDSFLSVVVDQGASDLHFHAGSPPLIRHDGELVALPFRTLSADETERFLLEVLSPELKAALDADMDVDFIYAVPGSARFRVNIFRQLHGLGAVFRVVPEEIPVLANLLVPPAVARLVDLQNGLVVITGPTGSGKTTTLAALVNEINTRQNRHVITIEDPIEFVHVSRNSVVTQRQVGTHAESFASALRSALREAPDVLIVGELRDLETMQLALQAAETGVLVFGTLHTGSAGKAIDRILDMVPEESREQSRTVLAVLLRAVMAQNLCRAASGDGRVLISELLLQNLSVSTMIRDDKVHQIDSYLQTASNAAEGAGSQSMDSCLFRFVRDGLVTEEDGLRYASYPDSLKKLLSAVKPED